DAVVPRGRDAAVVLPDVANARIPAERVADERTGLVGGAVVDDDDVDVDVGLREDRAHRARDAAGAVVGGDEDRNEPARHPAKLTPSPWPCHRPREGGDHPANGGSGAAAGMSIFASIASSSPQAL